MNSNSLLDALKKRVDVPSDYALARDILHVTPHALREMRERGLSDERALQVAELLDLNPGEVLAAIHAERSKTKEVKEAWERAAKALRAAAVGTCFFVVGALGGNPPNAQGSPQPGSNSGSVYITSNRRRALILAALRRFFGMEVSHAC